MDDEKHYPPGAEPETPPAPDAPAPEGDKAPEAEPEAQKPEDKPSEEKPDAPEAEKPKDGEKDPSAEPEPTNKPRSIYKDLKDERGKRKDAETRAAELEAENARLRAGGTPDKPAAPAEPSKPKDDLEAFAEEHEMDATGLSRLVEIIQKRIPSAELSEEDKKDIAELKTWRQERQRTEEDQSVLSTAPSVKDQLSIHDPAELDTVMKEVLRLAHTKEFHDKEVDYIVWKNRDALSKLVSPKKPSFEAGGHAPEAEPEAPIDFTSGKVTPEQVAKAMSTPGPKSQVEVRRSN